VHCSSQLSSGMHPQRQPSRRWPQNSQNNHSLLRCWPSVRHLVCNSRRWNTRKHRLPLANCSNQLSFRMHRSRPMSRKWPQSCQNNRLLPRRWPSVLNLGCNSRRWDTRKHRQRLGHRPRQPSRKRPQNFQTNHRWLSVRSAQTGLLTGPSLRKPTRKHRPGKKCLPEPSF